VGHLYNSKRERQVGEISNHFLITLRSKTLNLELQ